MRLTTNGLKKADRFIRALERAGATNIPTIEEIESGLREGCVESCNDFGNAGIPCLILKRGEDFVSNDEMDANEYQSLAMRTNDGKMTERIMRPVTEIPGVDLGGIYEGCLGLAGEAGEFIDLVKKWRCHQKPIDELHAKKELGDVLWYVALLCDSFGWKMSEVMNLNIEKLKKRYPDGFTPERANNRKEGDV